MTGKVKLFSTGKIVSFLSLLLWAGGLPLSFAKSDPVNRYLVEKVVDFNTLRLADGDHVRLIGVGMLEPQDESDKAKHQTDISQRISEIMNASKQATTFTKKLAEGKQVKIVFTEEKRDRKGNIPAYVYIYVCGPTCSIEAVSGYEYETFDDGTFIFLNATLIRSGYAKAAAIPKNSDKQGLLLKCEQQARAAKAGFWSKS